MLRELSMIKDSYGQHKFNPKAVIFVANFWDEVKKEDQKVHGTKWYIGYSHVSSPMQADLY